MTKNIMQVREVRSLKFRGYSLVSALGNCFGSAHSSPLKNNLEGNPSPSTISMPLIWFFVNVSTDCCFPGILGSFRGCDPFVSPIR